MKKYCATFIIFGVLLLAVCVGPGAADTRYVADQLVITLREGAGNEYRVMRTLRTDTPMEVLEEQGRYLRVRLDDGTEGYVLKQYISSNRPKSERIKELQAEIERLSARASEQAEIIEEAEQARAEAERLREELRAKEEELQEIRELSDDALMLDKERKRLQAELDSALEELSKLQEENRTMLSSASMKWFLAGGGTLFVGWIMGKLSRRKKRSDFSRL
jgi:SH3 domain protein